MRVIIVSVGTIIFIQMASYLSNASVVAQSQHDLARTRENIYGILQDRFGTNWGRVEQEMNSTFGPAWTNELTGTEWQTLNDFRQKLLP